MMAQTKQSLNIGSLTDRLNACCQATSYRSAIDFVVLIGTLSHPTLCVREPSGPFHANGCRVPYRLGYRSAHGEDGSSLDLMP
jgi:hypothetical protein